MKNVENNQLFDRKISAWQAVLEEVKLENNSLKNLLAEAISKNVSRKFVEQAEIFQQKFVDKDQVLDLLRHDISSLLKNRGITLKSGSQLKTLGRDIIRIQSELRHLKSAFYQYLQSQSESPDV